MDLAKFIDHTLLKADATVQEVVVLCEEAACHHFAAVCVNPGYVGLAAHLLAGTGVKVATVIGFPLGATFSAVKACEVKEALLRKVDELDMVMNIGAAKAGEWAAVEEDIRQVVVAAEGKTVKVIIETAYFSDAEKRLACLAVIAGGANFVKTSTGFGPSGATVEDIILLKETVRDQIFIKAAGGIRTRHQAEQFIAAGADRIGTSAGVEIIK